MKLLTFLLFILLLNACVFAQTISSYVLIVTVYSQNEKFYLKTIPFDNESPSLRGKTSVYKTGDDVTPLYVFERGFDDVRPNGGNLVLSDDGRVIFYVIPWDADDKTDGLKSVSIYRDGKLTKSFTEADLTGCDYKRERCRLLYSNFEQVVDQEKSKVGTREYKKVFKDGTDEKEKFLSDNPLFNFDDVAFLVDSKKKVHRFDLREGAYLGAQPFDEIYAQVKNKVKFAKIEEQGVKVFMFYPDFPKLVSGKKTHESLADYIGMKTADNANEKDEQYKLYTFKMTSNILPDGSIEIEDIELFQELPKEKIAEFFKTNRFDRSEIPAVFEKWNLRSEYFTFRKKDDRLARREKQQQIAEEREALKKRLIAEKIDDIYIPKDLGECFVELDRILSEVDKKEMKTQPKKEDMVEYHMGLGMWLRNNWGLWGGSRLQKYFTDRKITHPDDMSGVILEYYHDWLNGRTETWKTWEKSTEQ